MPQATPSSAAAPAVTNPLAAVKAHRHVAAPRPPPAVVVPVLPPSAYIVPPLPPPPPPNMPSTTAVGALSPTAGGHSDGGGGTCSSPPGGDAFMSALVLRVGAEVPPVTLAGGGLGIPHASGEGAGGVNGGRSPRPPPQPPTRRPVSAGVASAGVGPLSPYAAPSPEHMTVEVAVISLQACDPRNGSLALALVRWCSSGLGNWLRSCTSSSFPMGCVKCLVHSSSLHRYAQCCSSVVQRALWLSQFGCP
jgi:hypothetical protein